MGTTWELDFYSRPILDENNKKLWEILICESPASIDTPLTSLFKYAEYCSNTQVNSIFLREAIEKAIAKAGKTPTKIRFFRRQMNNMIIKGCEDAGIMALPSRRTYALTNWLAERMVSVYPQASGYDSKLAQSASVQYPSLNAVPLPDAIRGDKGDKWAFVTLEASSLAEMGEWDVSFGEAFPLDLAAIEPETKIPGMLIYSPRATPLAAWMSGLEMAYLELETGSFPRMRLETGVSDSWIIANLPNATTLAEAKNFVAAKEKAKGVHFLALQTSSNSETFAGFWLLKQ